MRQQKLKRYDTQEAEEKVKEALSGERPTEVERPRLPKITPVDKLEHSRLRPVKGK